MGEVSLIIEVHLMLFSNRLITMKTEGNSKLIMIKIIIIIQYDGLRVIWSSTIVLLVM